MFNLQQRCIWTTTHLINVHKNVITKEIDIMDDTKWRMFYFKRHFLFKEQLENHKNNVHKTVLIEEIEISDE
jgi:hypothetical protein